MKSQRRPVIAGNWKMFKLLGEAVEAVLELKPLIANVRNCDIVVAPPFTALKTLADRLEGSNIGIAAQNCSTSAEFGAYTGEVSARMIADVGCSYVIVGHSERRHYFGETDSDVNRKTHAVVEAGLTAIVCVGETLAQRETGGAEAVVSQQLTAGLSNLTVADTERIIIAYEPVWAIGTGKTATPGQAQEMHASIRGVLAKTHGDDAGSAMRILYGGSVKPDNIDMLMRQPDIDGALVGGASLDAQGFARIVKFEVGG